MKHAVKALTVALPCLVYTSYGCPGTPVSDLTTNIDREEVSALMARVADRQIENFSYAENGSPGRLHDYGIDAWTNATLYKGVLEWANTVPGSGKYLDWLREIGDKTDWTMPTNFVNHSYGLHHADELCIGQFYLGMYRRYGLPEMIAGVKARIDRIMASPPSPDMNARMKQSWTWCDALFMAPPVYTALAAVEGDAKYLDFMDTMFKRTYDHLYNGADGLFFRDDTYFDKREANGANVYWGRGNGWVAAGLAGILCELPKESPYRPFYVELFQRLITRLVSLQDEGGFWHASLLDPESYPAPEISATALTVYALAYGVNEGLLDRVTYLPAIAKGWSAIVSAIDAEGKVGWIQPIGADPKQTSRDMTAPYGVGAVLMAGAWVYKLGGGKQTR